MAAAARSAAQSARIPLASEATSLESSVSEAIDKLSNTKKHWKCGTVQETAECRAWSRAIENVIHQCFRDIGNVELFK